jgi:hypothetical protein
LNKGEAHHALKNALRIGQQGEIRNQTTEGQHYRMAGLSLLAAISVRRLFLRDLERACPLRIRTIFTELPMIAPMVR